MATVYAWLCMDEIGPWAGNCQLQRERAKHNLVRSSDVGFWVRDKKRISSAESELMYARSSLKASRER